MMRAAVWAAGILACGLTVPAFAQEQASPTPVQAYTTQYKGLTREAADALIAKLKDGQAKLKQGDKVSFRLLSGAPASYQETSVSPRDAFLGLEFAQPFSIEKITSDNALWNPYRILLLPRGLGRIVCDVEVVLGIDGNIERIEITYGPPAPF